MLTHSQNWLVSAPPCRVHSLLGMTKTARRLHTGMKALEIQNRPEYDKDLRFATHNLLVGARRRGDAPCENDLLQNQCLHLSLCQLLLRADTDFA